MSLFTYKIIDSMTNRSVAFAPSKSVALREAIKWSMDRIVEIQDQENNRLAAYYKGKPVK